MLRLPVFLAILGVSIGCSDANFGSKSDKNTSSSSQHSTSEQGDILGNSTDSAKTSSETDSDTKSEKTEITVDNQDRCQQAIWNGAGNNGGIFSGGMATATASGGSTSSSVSCGNLRLRTNEDGKCQLVIETQTTIDSEHTVGTINGKEVKFGDDGVSGEILDSGSYTISLKTSNAGSFATCTISVNVQ